MTHCAVVERLNPILPSDYNYDLTYVGAGASCSYSLIALLKKIKSSELEILKIAIFDQHPDFFTGIAYGPRSGSESLILTKLVNFFPAEELEIFGNWIRLNAYEAEIWPVASDETIKRLRGISIEKFILEMSFVCVRRHLIGEFIKWRVNNAISTLESKISISIDYFVGGVYKVAKLKSKSGGRYRIQANATIGDTRFICISRVVVLTIGSRPLRALPANISDRFKKCILNSPYEKGFDAHFCDFITAINMSENNDVRILLVGSNATAMDILYYLERWSNDTKRELHIDVVSGTGELPAEIPRIFDDVTEVVSEISELRRRGNVSSSELYDTAMIALQRMKSDGVSVERYNRSIDREVLLTLDGMEETQKLSFIRSRSNNLGRFKRRAEKEYHDATGRLIGEGKLGFVQGRVLDIYDIEDSIVADVKMTDGAVSSYKFSGVINCGSVEDMSENSSNKLIASIVDDKHLKFDLENNCVITLQDFEISDGMYVHGPMLSGNIVCGSPVWHMEHCGRIINYSGRLADSLLEKLEI